jgi:hypothetical protein
LRQSRRSVCARDGHAHLSNPDQKLPALATFANVRLKVTGGIGGETISISGIMAADR